MSDVQCDWCEPWISPTQWISPWITGNLKEKYKATRRRFLIVIELINFASTFLFTLVGSSIILWWLTDVKTQIQKNQYIPYAMLYYFYLKVTISILNYDTEFIINLVTSCYSLKFLYHIMLTYHATVPHKTGTANSIFEFCLHDISKLYILRFISAYGLKIHL